MFTVKFIKYANGVDGVPASVEHIAMRVGAAVHVSVEPSGRQVVQLGDAPGETIQATVGPGPECAYNVAYVMNASGKTVETVR